MAGMESLTEDVQERIFNGIPLPLLKNCRLVNSKWNLAIVNYWNSTTKPFDQIQIELVTKSNFDSFLYAPALQFLPLLHFTNFQLDLGSGTIEMIKYFSKTYATYLKYLEIVNMKESPPHVISQAKKIYVLLKYFKNLQVLKVPSTFSHLWIKSWIKSTLGRPQLRDSCHDNYTNLTELQVTYFSTKWNTFCSSVSYFEVTSHPLYKLIKMSPNLKKLEIPLGSGPILASHLAQILPSEIELNLRLIVKFSTLKPILEDLLQVLINRSDIVVRRLGLRLKTPFSFFMQPDDVYNEILAFHRIIKLIFTLICNTLEDLDVYIGYRTSLWSDLEIPTLPRLKSLNVSTSAYRNCMVQYRSMVVCVKLRQYQFPALRLLSLNVEGVVGLFNNSTYETLPMLFRSVKINDLRTLFQNYYPFVQLLKLTQVSSSRLKLLLNAFVFNSNPSMVKTLILDGIFDTYTNSTLIWNDLLPGIPRPMDETTIWTILASTECYRHRGPCPRRVKTLQIQNCSMPLLQTLFYMGRIGLFCELMQLILVAAKDVLPQQIPKNFENNLTECGVIKVSLTFL